MIYGLKVLAAVFTIGTLAACSAYQPVPPTFHNNLYEPYRLGAGDSVRVHVFEQPELTNSYTLDQTGNISIPLIDAVSAHGQTTGQLEKIIEAKLRAGFLRDPHVSIEIDHYRPIFIMGEVGEPGQYSYVSGMTAQQAIATANGFSSRAYQGDVDITREINGDVMTARVPVSDLVQPGDTLYIRERLF